MGFWLGTSSLCASILCIFCEQLTVISVIALDTHIYHLCWTVVVIHVFPVMCLLQCDA